MNDERQGCQRCSKDAPLPRRWILKSNEMLLEHIMVKFSLKMDTADILIITVIT